MFVEEGIGSTETPSPEDVSQLCRALRIRPTKKVVDSVMGILVMPGMDFSDLEAKERAIKADAVLHTMPRFRGLKMHFRDTVGMHLERIERMIQGAQHAIIRTFPGFDFDAMRYVARRHDVSEGMNRLGDVPTPIKRQLSEKMMALLKYIDRRCFEIISLIPDTRVLGPCESIFDKKNAEVRMALFDTYEKRQEPWAQILKYFDLLDAFMETLTEVLEHNNDAFRPIAERYRGEIQKIGQGEYLPAIRQIHENWRDIQEGINELFGPHQGFPRDSIVHAEQYEMFCGGLGLFGFEDLQAVHPKAFEYWKKHIFRPQGTRKPEWFIDLSSLLRFNIVDSTIGKDISFVYEVQ